MTTTTIEKPNPLESLAGEADNLAAASAPPPLGEGTTDADVAARQQAEEEAEGMRQIEGAAVGLVLMVLKLGRRFLAEKLPEVEETLPDEKLQAPAESFLPLIRKKAGALMETAAKSPELAVALIGVLPIAMGIMDAMTLAEKREAAAKKGRAPSAPQPMPSIEGVK